MLHEVSSLFRTGMAHPLCSLFVTLTDPEALQNTTEQYRVCSTLACQSAELEHLSAYQQRKYLGNAWV